MHKLLLSSAVIGSLGLATLPASAMSGVQALPLASSDQPEVTLVSGGCGPFRHRGWNGFCYPGGGFGPVVGYGAYGGYGYGWHRPWGWRGGWGWHRGWHRW